MILSRFNHHTTCLRVEKEVREVREMMHEQAQLQIG